MTPGKILSQVCAMNLKKIDKTIVDALNHPSDEARLKAVVSIGQPAYDRILYGKHPCPGVSHHQEAEEKIGGLVKRIAEIDPSIILDNANNKDPLVRSIVVGVAGGTGNPEFADIIIESLADRSLYVLDQAIWSLERRKYLWTSRAVELLRKLIASKRVKRCFRSTEKLHELADQMEESLRGQTTKSNTQTSK